MIDLFYKNIIFKFSKIIILLMLVLTVTLFFSAINLKIDASSDTLVAQNDKDFVFFNYYQKIFPSKNNLVIAVKSKGEINNNFIKEIKNLSKKITEFKEVSSVFNITKAPILFLNNTKLIL